jgi:di/tricarboxylate transporter
MTSPASGLTLHEGDVLILESDPKLLDSVVAAAKLELAGKKDAPKAPGGTSSLDARVGEDRPFSVVEAVIAADSPMIGVIAEQLALQRRFGVSLLAVSRRGRRNAARLHRIKFRSGDVVVLRGEAETMPETLARLGCLPLAERDLRLGEPRAVLLPLAILTAALAASAVEIVPAEVVFVAATALLALFGVLSLREIYESIEWPILILLGALIPVGEAVQKTGATDLIAGWLSHAATGLPPTGILAVVMIVTMLATPILHHAAAVIVMGPVAASLAAKLGLAVDPFLMAVAVGAGSDFLSPIGHQCNTLVLGPGGYRFGDYWRLGLPLSTIVVVVGVPLIMLFWPLK